MTDKQTLLAVLVGQERLSWNEAARKVCEASIANESKGSAASITGRHLARLARREGGPTRPNPATCRALQFAFGYTIDDLLADHNPQTKPIGARDAGSTRSSSEVLTVAADRARRFTTELQQGTTAESLDLMHEEVRDLIRAYPVEPLPILIGHFVAGQDTVFSLLERPQNPTNARRLYFLGAVLGGLIAKASHDMSEPYSALTQSRTAWLCAEQADHNGLRAWVSGLQSLVSYWARRPGDAIRYAERGSEHATRARSTAGVWLASNEARAWAALGNVERTREAIRQAERAWETVGPDDLDELGGFAVFSRPRQLYYAADALAWLPDATAETRDYAASAVSAYSDTSDPNWAFGDAAGSRCDLAVAYLHAQDLDAAADALAPVLELPPEKRINGVVASVDRVQSSLVPMISNRAGAELQERIEEFKRVTIKALPR